jgi:quercetin dioxygenase-like cupin family protein
MTWEPAPLPGIFSKLLFNDVNRQYVTQIVRMDPGTTYPSHRHSQVEELYLLEGDLLVEGQKMGPGDYCRGEPESVHGEVYTETGALFFVLSSPQDEILA